MCPILQMTAYTFEGNPLEMQLSGSNRTCDRAMVPPQGGEELLVTQRL